MHVCGYVCVCLCDVSLVVAMQYPGVAQSIDSDVNNIMTLMNKTKLLPEGR